MDKNESHAVKWRRRRKYLVFYFATMWVRACDANSVHCMGLFLSKRKGHFYSLTRYEPAHCLIISIVLNTTTQSQRINTFCRTVMTKENKLTAPGVHAYANWQTIFKSFGIQRYQEREKRYRQDMCVRESETEC